MERYGVTHKWVLKCLDKGSTGRQPKKGQRHSCTNSSMGNARMIVIAIGQDQD